MSSDDGRPSHSPCCHSTAPPPHPPHTHVHAPHTYTHTYTHTHTCAHAHTTPHTPHTNHTNTFCRCTHSNIRLCHFRIGCNRSGRTFGPAELIRTPPQPAGQHTQPEGRSPFLELDDGRCPGPTHSATAAHSRSILSGWVCQQQCSLARWVLPLYDRTVAYNPGTAALEPWGDGRKHGAVAAGGAVAAAGAVAGGGGWRWSCWWWWRSYWLWRLVVVVAAGGGGGWRLVVLVVLAAGNHSADILF